MEHDRQIRFLIPPFVLIFSILIGAYFGGYDLLNVFEKGYDVNALLIFFAGSASVIAMGFIISSISIIILRLISFLFGRYTYEAALDEETLKRIWGKINTTIPFDIAKILFVAATYNHDKLSPRIHEWIMRRWNSFHISFHSFVSLLLSHLLGAIFRINESLCWLIVTATLCGIFLINAIISWKETMGMVEFQSHCLLNKNNR